MEQVKDREKQVALQDFSVDTKLPEGPEWVQEYRRQGQNLYPEVEKPRWDGTRLKHKKLRRRELDPFKFPIRRSREVNPSELPSSLEQFMNRHEGAARAQVGGSVTATRLPERLREKGVVFMELLEAAKEHPEIVKKHFAEHYPLTDDDDYKESIKFLALNQALWSTGTLIYVPDNVVIEEPIRLETLLDADTTGAADRLLIVAGRNSEFTVIESLQSEGTPGERLRTHVNEVFVQDGARVRFASLQNFQQDTWNVAFRKATVERDGHFEWILGDLGGKFNLYYNLSETKGEGAYAGLKGVFFGSDEQRFRFQNYMTQSGPHTTTDMVAHGALTDTSRLVYLGLARIIEGATGANARQSEKSLLLNNGARNDAIPELEIDEDDVIAEHAATVGEVDEDQVYYMRTKGLPRKRAEKMIVEGSFNPVTDEIKNDQLREEVKQLIRKKLASHFDNQPSE